MKYIRGAILAAAFATAFAWPAATQNSGTSLGSETTAHALQRLTVPQNGDIAVIYRGQNGGASYTTIVPFMAAASVANAQANFGGL